MNNFNICFFFLLVLVLISCQTEPKEQEATENTALREDVAPVNTPPARRKDTIKVMPFFNAPKPTPVAQAKTFGKDYLMGKFDPAKNADFVKVEASHGDRDGLYLRKETYEAFKKMFTAAKKEGITLTIRSATRSFYQQKAIWEGKWTGGRKLQGGVDASKAFPNSKDRALKILEFSSMPGTSRHHWGTDIDLNNFTNAYFEKGRGLKEYNWLKANAATYGFCQPYTAKDAQRPNGYNEEKWHWSYTPVAKQLTKEAQETLANETIGGFKGAETAKEIDVVKKYVLGINQACL